MSGKLYVMTLIETGKVRITEYHVEQGVLAPTGSHTTVRVRYMNFLAKNEDLNIATIHTARKDLREDVPGVRLIPQDLNWREPYIEAWIVGKIAGIPEHNPVPELAGDLNPTHDEDGIPL